MTAAPALLRAVAKTHQFLTFTTPPNLQVAVAYGLVQVGFGPLGDRIGKFRLVALATLVLTVLLYVAIPKGFFPVQDTGLIQGVSEASQSISYGAMAERQRALAEAILTDPDVDSLVAGIGDAALEQRDGEFGQQCLGLIFVDVHEFLVAREPKAEGAKNVHERSVFNRN